MEKLRGQIECFDDHGAPPFYVGVDVGGTNIKIGLVDDAGKTIARKSISTWEEKGPSDAIERIYAVVNELAAKTGLAWEGCRAVGLGTPGSMDIPGGMILEPPNLPHWRNFPIRDRLSERCERPVAFANDANAAAFGEYWVGSGRDYSSMVMFTLGTGVGGGIILGGRSLDGEHSFGSELGHIVIDSSENARLCVWGGGRGQLEAYASASAVIARAREALQSGQPTSVNERLARGEDLTPLLLYEEAAGGDEFSTAIIDETARFLAIGIVTVVHTVDPGIIVLGGAMDFGGDASPVGRRFLSRIQEEFRRRAFPVVRDTPIAFARLGGTAGYIGAAGLARAALTRG